MYKHLKSCLDFLGPAAQQLIYWDSRHKFGFPQCVGVVDGTYVPTVSPVEYPADYYNHKGFHSILMQGTVNHLGHFIDIYIAWPGWVHDA